MESDHRLISYTLKSNEEWKVVVASAWTKLRKQVVEWRRLP